MRALRVAIAVVLASQTALGAPKNGEARKQFDKGVAAYTKGDYAAAAEALGASFVLEADAETLFAWAQTERKLGHCDRALELYTKLLAMDLPAENKQAVQAQIGECQAILAEQKPAPAPKPAPTMTAAEPAPAAAPVPPDAAQPLHDEPKAVDSAAWWKDPIGGALVGGGVAVLGLGTVFLVQGASIDANKGEAISYQDYEARADKAELRGRLGVIGLAAGSVLVIGGVIRYAMHAESSERTVTTLVVPGGAGVALSGTF